MDHLAELESNSIFIIREGYQQFKKVAMLWSIGKDSTTLLWLIRKAFYGKPPFSVLHLDTGYKFKEIYAFRETYAKEWSLDLICDPTADRGVESYCYDPSADRGVFPLSR